MKMTIGLLVLVLATLLLVSYCGAHKNTAGLSLSEEKLLIQQLVDKYAHDGKHGRPVKLMNATLKVSYGISLVQIIHVDEKDQVLTTNVWCKYKWRDETISWDPAEHENIAIIRVPINAIWKPDFVLYNYADERLSEHRSVMALIDPEGYVTYIPPAIFKSTCFIDTTYFPFDEQSCHLKFGSWTYNGNALDLFFFDDKEYIELSDYVSSQEWIILEHYAQKHVALYECCPNEPYPDLTFYLKLRRRGTFYSYTLILPCVLLSFITMILFMLPPETPAKMLLGINIFVAFFMLLLLLQESTPPTSKKIPMLGAYYCFNMVMTTVSTFLCSILVDMHYRADKRNPPPRWLTFLIVDILAKSMFIRPTAVAWSLSAASHYHSNFSKWSRSYNCSTCFRKIRKTIYSIGYCKNCKKLNDCVDVSDDDEDDEAAEKKGDEETAKNNDNDVEKKENVDEEVVEPQSISVSKTSLLVPEISGMPRQSILRSPNKANRSQNRRHFISFEEPPLTATPHTKQQQRHFDKMYEQSAIKLELGLIRGMLRKYTKKMVKKEANKRNAEAWRMIAMVLDRMFLFGYMLSMIFSVTTLFPQRPGDLDDGLRFPNGTLITTNS